MVGKPVVERWWDRGIGVKGETLLEDEGHEDEDKEMGFHSFFDE